VRLARSNYQDQWIEIPLEGCSHSLAADVRAVIDSEGRLTPTRAAMREYKIGPKAGETNLMQLPNGYVEEVEVVSQEPAPAAAVPTEPEQARGVPGCRGRTARRRAHAVRHSGLRPRRSWASMLG
jgi:hypothetical protein